MSDDRFIYGSPNTTEQSKRQLITGDEVKTFLPRGNPARFSCGSSYEFQIDNQPFLISQDNYLEISVVFRRKEKTAKGVDPKPWTACEASDRKFLHLSENFGSALIEDVGMREGLSDLNISGFLPRGRFLYENLVLSHSDVSVRRHYTYREQDPAIHNYLTEDKFCPGSDAYEKFLKEGENLVSGMKLNVVPFSWPFQYKNRSTMRPSLFPNTGAPLSIVVKLISNYKHLFHTEDATANDTCKHNYKVEVTGMKLHLGVPRLSSEGLSVITNRNLAPLKWPCNYVVQYSQSIVGNPVELHFNLTDIQIPHYMILQSIPQDYFTGEPEPENDFAEAVYKPLEFPLAKAKIRFNNRDISYETANFDVSRPESAFLRQAIMKNSDIFESKLMDQSYWDGMKDYQQHHFAFSFLSNQRNGGALLRPLDFTGSPNEKQTLSVGLYSPDRLRFKPGKLIITLIYKDVGMEYNVRTGTFADRDIKSLVLS